MPLVGKQKKTVNAQIPDFFFAITDQFCHSYKKSGISIFMSFLSVLAIVIAQPAFAQKSSQPLPDGDYVFASRLPDKTKHPDIQLAGAEIYAFRKTGSNVIGEHFVANSSDISCFRGKLSGNTIVGEGLEIPFPRENLKPMRFEISVDLNAFNRIKFDDIAYAQGSVKRCTEQFKGI
jgi:hypothetical protein